MTNQLLHVYLDIDNVYFNVADTTPRAQSLLLGASDAFQTAVDQACVSLSLDPEPAFILKVCPTEFFIENLQVRIDFIIVTMRWTGLAPWDVEFPFPGSLTSTFLVRCVTSIVEFTFVWSGIRIVRDCSHLPARLGAWRLPSTARLRMCVFRAVVERR